MNALDQHIVNALQDGIDVCERPFAALATQLGVTQACIVARLRDLLERGVLSRFGPMFDAQRMGGAFHLCAMAVPPQDFDDVVAAINAHPEVAHNYEREHAFNVWFVLGSDDEASIARTIALIESQTCYPVYDMPKLSEYYVGLRLDAGPQAPTPRRQPEEPTCA